METKKVKIKMKVPYPCFYLGETVRYRIGKKKGEAVVEGRSEFLEQMPLYAIKLDGLSTWVPAIALEPMNKKAKRNA